MASKGGTQDATRDEEGKQLSVLVVDDEDDFRRMCELSVASLGHRVETVSSAAEAFDRLGSGSPDVVLLDILMSETSGLQALREIKETSPDVEVIVMSGHASVPWAVEAMRGGAADYLVKPFDAQALGRALAVAERMGGLVRENTRLRRELDDAGAVPLIGRSRAMTALRRMVRKLASSDVSVLIVGESGTGKEVAARAICRGSIRRDRPFVPVDCGSIAQGLIESELFGHKKGAFTGADRDREGLIGSADGGTLFLDEIGEMSAEAQVRLLRVLETGEVRPVGSSEARHVDVRVIAATNRDLENEESFRRDLFFRLNVVALRMPALRERIEDVPLLAEHFFGKLRSAGSTCERFSAEAMSALESYGWPGNVRELGNAVERCGALATGLAIELGDLPPAVVSSSGGDRGGLRTLQEIRRTAIERTLEAVDNDRKKAATILGIDRSTLYRSMKQFNLTPPPKSARREDAGF
jgi:two-component system response regulator HydG